MNSLAFLDPIKNKRIVIAPLNWGLGHATRSMPIIDHLRRKNEVIVASDGLALRLLRSRYPDLQTIELPAYDIEYGGHSMVWAMMRQLPKITKAVAIESALIEEIVDQYQVDMIISDHRLGCRDARIPSFIIAHQIRLRGGSTLLSSMANRVHRQFINRFTECWIPDYEHPTMKLSGELSDSTGINTKRYIGPLSRLRKQASVKKIDLSIILSGPEPARSVLEQHLDRLLPSLGLSSVVLVRGTDRRAQLNYSYSDVIDMADSTQLSTIISGSKVVLSRSGYTSIMDLSHMHQAAIWIPTPGQPEQEYLAEYLSDRERWRVISENDLKADTLLDALRNVYLLY